MISALVLELESILVVIVGKDYGSLLSKQTAVFLDQQLGGADFVGVGEPLHNLMSVGVGQCCLKKSKRGLCPTPDSTCVVGHTVHKKEVLQPPSVCAPCHAHELKKAPWSFT